ncbi:hypothetical protein AB1L30_13970 [Bremerella sp. JC817]|uniref:hypothetical protein n=1 Tax=Bremerella sp. JC817 TaxID=3231756 RepID=UPI0034578391
MPTEPLPDELPPAESQPTEECPDELVGCGPPFLAAAWLAILTVSLNNTPHVMLAVGVLTIVVFLAAWPPMHRYFQLRLVGLALLVISLPLLAASLRSRSPYQGHLEIQWMTCTTILTFAMVLLVQRYCNWWQGDRLFPGHLSLSKLFLVVAWLAASFAWGNYILTEFHQAWSEISADTIVVIWCWAIRVSVGVSIASLILNDRTPRWKLTLISLVTYMVTSQVLLLLELLIIWVITDPTLPSAGALYQAGWMPMALVQFALWGSIFLTILSVRTLLDFFRIWPTHVSQP